MSSELRAVPTATDEECEQYARDRPSLPHYVRALLRLLDAERRQFEIVAATLRQVEEALDAEQAKVARVVPAWAEGNRNDGKWEYVEATDCDGSHLAFWRRRPALVADAESWERAEQIPHQALYPEQHRAAFAEQPEQARGLCPHGRTDPEWCDDCLSNQPEQEQGR